MRESRDVEQMAFLTDAGIVRATSQGTIMEINPAFARILGRPAPQLIGRKLGELQPCVPHGAGDILRAFANRTLTKPIELFQEVGGVSLLVVVRPFYEEQVLGSVVITAFDVTSARGMQRIAEDRARKAEAYLCQLGNRVTRPVEALAHTARSLGDGADPAFLLSWVKLAGRCAEDLLVSVNDFLALAASEPKNTPSRVREFRLGDLLGQVEGVLAVVGRSRGLELRIEIEDPMLESEIMRGDPRRLRQILLGMMATAIEMGESASVLHVSRKDPPSAGSEDLFELLFEVPFSGTPSTRARRFEEIRETLERGDPCGSVGLTELALAGRLAADMGGDIHPAGSPTGGVIVFEAAFEKGKTSSPGRTTRAERLDTGANPKAGRLRILVADDNTINQRVAFNLLANMGHAVVVVEDGAEALDILKREHFDLVLMDIQMPVKDGLTATREIREGKGGVADPMVPIVAMTAHALEGDREACFEAGMNDFLAKPIRSEELDRIIEGLVSKGRGVDLDDSGAWPIRSVSAFNREWLVSRYDGDAELADDAIRAFIDEICPAYLRKSQTAIESNRRDDLAKAAHALWGACATVGAFRLQGICRELYQNAATQPAEELRARWEDAYRDYLALKS